MTEKHTILVVDDEPDVLKSIGLVLEAEGYAVMSSSSGAEALEKIAEREPAVAVVDLRLGDMSGIDVIRAIKKCFPDTECILLTGHSTQDSAIEATNLGAYSYLMKPRGIQELSSFVSGAIAKRDSKRWLEEEVKRRTAEVVITNEKLKSRIDELSDFRKATIYMLSDLDKTSKELALAWDYADNIIRSMVDMLVVLNPDSTIRTVNQATLDVLGYKEDEVIGKHIDMILEEEERASSREGIDELIGKGTVRNIEKTYLTKDNRRIPVFFSASVMWGADCDHENLLEDCLAFKEKGEHCKKMQSVVCVAQDITERIHAEEKLNQQRQQLAHVDRVVRMGELASSLAHEINQPLTGILSNAQAAKRFLAEDKPDLDEIRNIVTDIVADDKRAGEVIRRLRALLRNDDSAREFLDINDVIREVLKIVHCDTVIRNLSIEIAFDEDLPKVLADQIQLQQVVLNLIINGRQAMDDVSGAERKLMISTAGDTASGVTISVSDAGVGIKGELLEQIFDPFYTTKFDGMGMGLSICRTIVKAHGGTMWAENNPDCGAKVCFTVPAAT